MSISKQLFVAVLVQTLICLLAVLSCFSMEQPVQVNPHVERLINRVREVEAIANESVHRSNAAEALAHHANEVVLGALRVSNETWEISNRAFERANNAVASIDQIRGIPEQAERRAQVWIANLENEYNRLREGLMEVTKNQNDFERENRIHAQATKIHEKHRLGIFEQEERIRAQAAVDIEATKWDKMRAMIEDPKFVLKIVLAVTALALGVYGAKYGIPVLMDCLTQPQVVSETSKTGWFRWGSPQEEIKLSDLIFAPALHNKLFDLVLRVQSAKTYNENLPNVLFYGPSGTGKTAFAKALAYYSGLNYALTSGSEFAKITDLNTANNELRKLLGWGQNDDKGLIIFIDEAESLFANRKLVGTSKSTQDFINTFLALVPEKSQKNLMFVFATNHPFKLDDAITNRIGVNVEFTLPEASEREKILATYLLKFAQENKEAIVDVLPEIMESLAIYVQKLEGFCPRAIKFVAEEMVINARRQAGYQLTAQIAEAALDQAKRSLLETIQWAHERDEWVRVGSL